MLIDVESYDYFSAHTQDSEGVLVLIQHYRDIPLMRKESFMLSPGFEVGYEILRQFSEIVNAIAVSNRRVFVKQI